MGRKIRKSRVSLVIVILVAIILIAVVAFGKTLNKDKNEVTNMVLNEVFNNTQNEIAENSIANGMINEVADSENNETQNEIVNEIDNSDKNDEDKNNDVNNETEKPDAGNDNEGETNKPSSNVKFDETVAFIGDSRTQGFIMYNGLKYVQDYSYVGLMVDTAVTKKFVKTSGGREITLIEDMANKDIEKVYIMLGVNELGWSYPEVFKVKYEELIDEIRKVQSNCDIYVQSIIPVTKERDQSDNIYNNTNIKKFNKLIKEVANDKSVTYLDVQSALVNSAGYLPDEASTDGIHVSPAYCEKWLNYLKNHS